MTRCVPVDLRPGILPALAAALPDRYPVLLDSAAQGALSRYSVLAAFPRAALWQDGAGKLHAIGQPVSGPAPDAPFLATLQQWIRDVQPTTMLEDAPAAELPFRGGWMVYLSYEMADEVEPRLKGRMPQGDVLRAARDVAASSDELARGNAELSTRTERSASNLQHTATAVEQISTTAAGSSAKSHEASEAAGRARDA